MHLENQVSSRNAYAKVRPISRVLRGFAPSFRSSGGESLSLWKDASGKEETGFPQFSHFLALAGISLPQLGQNMCLFYHRKHGNTNPD